MDNKRPPPSPAAAAAAVSPSASSSSSTSSSSSGGDWLRRFLFFGFVIVILLMAYSYQHVLEHVDAIQLRYSKHSTHDAPPLSDHHHHHHPPRNKKGDAVPPQQNNNNNNKPQQQQQKQQRSAATIATAAVVQRRRINLVEEPYRLYNKKKNVELARPLNLSRHCALPQANALREDMKKGKKMTICLNGTYPRFIHEPPRFLNDTDDEKLFMLQFENTYSLQPNWVNWGWETCVELKPGETQLIGTIPKVWMWCFQHFHDNGVGLVFQVRQLFDVIQNAVSPCRLKEILIHEKPNPGHDILHEEWNMLGFASNTTHESIRLKPTTTLNRYPKDKDQMRMHKVHAEWLRGLFPHPEPPEVNKGKVLWISRQMSKTQGGGGHALGRQFMYDNETTVIKYLKKKIPGLKRLKPEKVGKTVSNWTNTLYDACAIIGLHGGQLYNQFFANSKTSVVEILPVREGGYIDRQTNFKRPPELAHRAIWHNANALGQPYWRLHFVTPRATGFVFGREILERIVRTVRLSGCTTTVVDR